MAAPLLSKMGGSSCCSLSDIKKSATASVDNLMLMTVPPYKPDFGWIFDLSDAVTMLIYPAFLPPLGRQRLHKVRQTRPINAGKVIVVGINISISLSVTVAMASICCGRCSSLAALHWSNNSIFKLQLQQLQLKCLYRLGGLAGGS
jgi:hypothetical protein